MTSENKTEIDLSNIKEEGEQVDIEDDDMNLLMVDESLFHIKEESNASDVFADEDFIGVADDDFDPSDLNSKESIKHRKRKRNKESLLTNESPKKRNVLNLTVKIEVLKKFQDCEKVADISRAMEIPESTVRYIIKNKKRIEQCASNFPSTVCQSIKRPQHEMISVMESMLFRWIVDRRQISGPLSQNVIQTKALSIFQHINSNSELNFDVAKSFKASNGWFDGFKQRFKLKNVHIYGEAGSVDSSSVPAYVLKFKSLIEEGRYSPKQVFNVDETALYWKKMPSKTFITNEEKAAVGLKASKDRITLLLGGNAAGDVKLKPLLLYRSKNPRALKNIDKDSLPVIWRSNAKAWMARTDFESWMTEYFVPFVREYNRINNLDNKAVLCIDNAPGHSEKLCDKYPSIHVEFLPPNTTALLQPMDQGVIRVFKAFYLRECMRRIIEKCDRKEDLIRNYWKDYNVKHAIDLIDTAWQSISSSTLNASWKNLWPDCTEHGNDNISDMVKNICTEVHKLAQDAGFTNVVLKDINELLQSHDSGMSNEELYEIHQDIVSTSAPIFDDNVEHCISNSEQTDDKEKITEAFELAEKLKNKVSEFEKDPKKLRSFQRSIDALMSYYEDE